ncbi:MAG TPA: serine hydrolase [Gemmatimonadaceae bacterium]|nr:serine hydrolase [Gemmatimonadaceae bacterium]
MHSIRPFHFLIALAVIAPASSYAQAREPYPGFDAYVETARKTWKVPGVAIAIVRNDSVILAKGYGVKDIAKPDRVTERTMFAIGSSSKAFTSAGLGILVDEKKVAWDDPAEKHLSGFHLFDPYASRELTIRDILSHRSGLARGDMLWYGTELDRDEILRRTRFLEPSWSFRAQFGYQNLMYLAAGQLTARVANMSWDDFIERRIFQPLGMSESNTTIKKLSAMRDVATPHAEIEDTVRVVPWRNVDNIAPAGSINSHVVDMAQWVRLQLGKGKFAGKQIVSERQIEEMHAPHTIVRLEGTWKRFQPGAHIMAYGLGWFLSDYQGRLVVQHGGNIDGMSALVAMLPEEKLGVVILTNMGASALPYVVMHKLWDLHLKTPKARDWNAEMRRATDSLLTRAREAQKKREAERVANTKPSLPIEQYAGVYADSMYGEIRVRADSGKLKIDRGPAFQGVLEHWHFDTFRARWAARSLGTSFVTFRLNAQGKVDDLQMDLGGAPTSFKRRPEPATEVRAAGGSPR